MRNRKLTITVSISLLLVTLGVFIVIDILGSKSTRIISTSDPSDKTNSNKVVLAFTTHYYSADKSSYNQIISHSHSINDIATNTYTIDKNGNLSGSSPKDQITYANSNGIKTLAMITNNFNDNVSKVVLEDSTARQALVKNILHTLKSNNYKGVNIDLEGVTPKDRYYYTDFVRELYTELHSLGFTVTVSLPAKTKDNPDNSWNGAYDYSEIEKYVDQVVIMAYDEHSPDGTAGPIASIGWVKNVVKYAKTTMPSTKILLGVAAYGYDWSSNQTKAYSIDSIYNLAETSKAQIKWDKISETPYLNYIDKAEKKHVVWFENSTSLSYKLDIVNDNNLGGIAIWRLGLENTDYWSTIDSKLNK